MLIHNIYLLFVQCKTQPSFADNTLLHYILKHCDDSVSARHLTGDVLVGDEVVDLVEELLVAFLPDAAQQLVHLLPDVRLQLLLLQPHLSQTHTRTHHRDVIE